MDDEIKLDDSSDDCEQGDQGKPNDRLKRGAYLFPNLVTSAGLLAGLWSISKSFDGDFILAAWAIVLAGVFDGVDGKVARLTKTTSEFGIQYDSLADLVSFGVAPGVMIFQFALRHSFSPGLGWAVAILFTMCGALRLARFNVQTATMEGGWFIGLPIPGGAGVLASTVLFIHHLGYVQGGLAQHPNLIMILTAIAALAMVSVIPYWSMKELGLFKRHTFWTLFGLIVLMSLIFREPEKSLFFIGVVYLFSGPVVWFVRRKSKQVSAA